MIAHRRARYLGEPVAIVVAETEAQARDAAELIEVDYAPLDAVGDIAAATAAGAPLVWDDAPGNVFDRLAAGDAAATERAFAAAAACHAPRSGRQPSHHHADGAGRRARRLGPGAEHYTLHAPSQGVHFLRRDLAGPVFGSPRAR